jgi:hypothetical protein
MSQHLHQAFGRELVAQRQAEFQSAARHSALVRSAKLARREHALAAGADLPASPPTSSVSAAKAARARCAADLG